MKDDRVDPKLLVEFVKWLERNYVHQIIAGQKRWVKIYPEDVAERIVDAEHLVKRFLFHFQ